MNGMIMYRGNTKQAAADGAKIARRLRRMETTLTQLMSEYHCSYYTMMRVILSHLSLPEWKIIRRKILGGSGIKTRFKKGQEAWNKGTHFCAGGRSAETRFKPGQIRGSAARRYKAVGKITIRKDSLPKHLRNRKRKEGMPPWPRNYRRYIKTKDTRPSQYNWMPYARYLWEQANGPVPKGCFVVHVDGNTLNDNLDNYRCVDRKGHLALQLQRDPNMRRKMIASSMRTRRKQREHKSPARKFFNKQKKLPVVWECTGCGNSYCQKEPPSQCTKCVGGGFEKIVLRPHKISA